MNTVEKISSVYILVLKGAAILLLLVVPFFIRINATTAQAVFSGILLVYFIVQTQIIRNQKEIAAQQANIMEAQTDISVRQSLLNELAILASAASETRQRQYLIGREITANARDVFHECDDQQKLQELAYRDVGDLRKELKELQRDIQPGLQRIKEIELQLRKMPPFANSADQPENTL
ncbi:hypothetical protein ACFL6S_10760 [Candidatus Poribacteria bacterium]